MFVRLINKNRNVRCLSVGRLYHSAGSEVPYRKRE